MKIKKSLLSVCLSISLMFGCLVPSISVYASSDNNSGSNFLSRNWNKAVTWASGIITDSVEYGRDFINWLTEHKSDYDIPSNTNPEDWLDDNIDLNGDNITFNNNVINAIRDCGINYISNYAGYTYLYSVSSSSVVSSFDTQEHFQAFQNFLTEYDGKFIQVTDYDFNYLLVYNCDLSVFRRVDSNGYIAIYPYNDNWQLIDYGTRYKYNSTTNNYDVYQENNNNYNSNILLKSYPSISDPVVPYYYCYNLYSTPFICYGTVEGLRDYTSGVQDYYITDSYNTNHTDTDITTSISTIGDTISYSNVQDYVNNYYTDNSSYPTITQITQYINNYEGGSGGGSGDGDDDDEESGFFELIKKVLDFISQLFDTIAGFLADLVDSLGDVVTALVDNIFNIINSLKDGIPNAIGSLLEYLLPFLPEELMLMIRSAILFTIIIGIIKLLRG